MKLLTSGKIYLADSKIASAGRGVFAGVDIKIGELIERCPVILLNEDQTPLIRDTELVNYYFMWGNDNHYHKAAICLGFGSLYNHSYNPNATYKKRITEQFVDFVAVKDIVKDQEITVNYNHGDPDDKRTLWIKSIPPAEE